MTTNRTTTEQPTQAGAPLSPTSPHLAAVWGAFLHEGMMLNSADIERSIRLLDLWGNGCIELIQSVCEYIPVIWQYAQPYWDQPHVFPGVFEYEVVSILGEQIATHMLKYEGNLPSDREFAQMASELVTQFFSQGDKPPDPPAGKGPISLSVSSFLDAARRCFGGNP